MSMKAARYEAVFGPGGLYVAETIRNRRRRGERDSKRKEVEDRIHEALREKTQLMGSYRSGTIPDRIRAALVDPTTQDIQSAVGTGGRAGLDIGVERGEVEGTRNPALRHYSPNELAPADRAEFIRSTTRSNPLAGAVGAGGLVLTDLLKASGLQSPVAGTLMPALGFDEEATKQFTDDPTENTSDASLGQTLRNIRGTLGGAGQGLVDIGELGLDSAKLGTRMLKDFFQNLRRGDEHFTPSGEVTSIRG